MQIHARCSDRNGAPARILLYGRRMHSPHMPYLGGIGAVSRKLEPPAGSKSIFLHLSDPGVAGCLVASLWTEQEFTVLAVCSLSRRHRRNCSVLCGSPPFY